MCAPTEERKFGLGYDGLTALGLSAATPNFGNAHALKYALHVNMIRCYCKHTLSSDKTCERNIIPSWTVAANRQSQ